MPAKREIRRLRHGSQGARPIGQMSTGGSSLVPRTLDAAQLQDRATRQSLEHVPLRVARCNAAVWDRLNRAATAKALAGLLSETFS